MSAKNDGRGSDSRQCKVIDQSSSHNNLKSDTSHTKGKEEAAHRTNGNKREHNNSGVHIMSQLRTEEKHIQNKQACALLLAH
eukprot:857232-Rhodomonas_salina.1